MEERVVLSPAHVRLPVTAEQLRSFGIRELVYLKPDVYHGRRAFMIYRADGEPIERVDDMETAAGMAAEYGFKLLAIH